MRKLPAINPDLEIPEIVAIVGNSPNLLNDTNGANIDSHDCVVRFNGAVTQGFEKHAGSKTSIQVIGIDLAYLFHPRYRRGSKEQSQEKLSEVRQHNACEITSQFPSCKYITFDPSDSKRNAINPQYASAQYLTKAKPDIDLYAFNERGSGSFMTYYEANKELELLGLRTRLSHGGPRTGPKIVLRLLMAGIKPTLFGFDIDTSIQVARHYFDDVIQDQVDSYKPHDIRGEMELMSELVAKDMIRLGG